MAQLEPFDDFIKTTAIASWELFRREPLMFVLASVVVWLISFLSVGLLAGPLHVGFIELTRRAHRGEPIALGILFSRFDTLIPSLVAFVLVAIAVSLGLLLLVLPGLVAMLFSTYTLHAIAYEGLGGVEAIRRSIALVRTYFVQTLALVLVLWCLWGVGGLLAIMLLVTTPLSYILLTLGYEALADASRNPELVVEP